MICPVNDLDVIDRAYARLCLAIVKLAEWDMQKDGGWDYHSAWKYFYSEGSAYQDHMDYLALCYPHVAIERRAKAKEVCDG